MGLTLKDFYVPNKPYITKKLERDTLIKLLDSSSFVVDGIYKIANQCGGDIEIFNESVIDTFKVNGYVKVNYAYAGRARAQVASLKPWRKLIRKRPSYNLRVNIYNAESQVVYQFSQRYTRINSLMDAINVQHHTINQLYSSIFK